MTHQLVLPFPPDDTLPPFILAACNEAALAWLDRPQDWPDGRLVLAAPKGLGKTHFARMAAGRMGGALWTGATLGDVLRPPRFVVVDDADHAPEPALLHLLNAAREGGGRVLLTMALAPSHASYAVPDLASRLRAAAVTTLDPPDDDLLAAILLSACAARQLAVPEPVQAYLRLRLPRTADAMRDVAARLDQAAMISARTVTRALAGAVLRELGCHTDADDTAEPVRYATHTLLQGGLHEPR